VLAMAHHAPHAKNHHDFAARNPASSGRAPTRRHARPLAPSQPIELAPFRVFRLVRGSLPSPALEAILPNEPIFPSCRPPTWKLGNRGGWRTCNPGPPTRNRLRLDARRLENAILPNEPKSAPPIWPVVASSHPCRKEAQNTQREPPLSPDASSFRPVPPVLHSLLDIVVLPNEPKPRPGISSRNILLCTNLAQETAPLSRRTHHGPAGAAVTARFTSKIWAARASKRVI
jgi:hypothetical protein